MEGKVGEETRKQDNKANIFTSVFRVFRSLLPVWQIGTLISFMTPQDRDLRGKDFTRHPDLYDDVSKRGRRNSKSPVVTTQVSARDPFCDLRNVNPNLSPTEREGR